MSSSLIREAGGESTVLAEVTVPVSWMWTLWSGMVRTSLDYFRSPEAEPVLARIRNAGNVVHY